GARGATARYGGCAKRSAIGSRNSRACGLARSCWTISHPVRTVHSHRQSFVHSSGSPLRRSHPRLDFVSLRLYTMMQTTQRAVSFSFPSCAGWSSPVAREAHNLEVLGSNPSPATL